MITVNKETPTADITEAIRVAKDEVRELVTISNYRRLTGSEEMMLKLAKDTVSIGERILEMRKWRSEK